MAATPGSAAIVAYGTYVPAWRLDRAAITATLGQGGGRGTRAVASFDEDTTSMGVEAARRRWPRAPTGFAPDDGAVRHHGARLPRQDQRHRHPRRPGPARVGRRPTTWSARSAPASGALRLAGAHARGRPWSCSRDVRTGLPGGGGRSRRRRRGRGLRVRRLGRTALVEVLAAASSTEEFLDRWRVPGETSSRCGRSASARRPTSRWPRRR